MTTFHVRSSIETLLKHDDDFLSDVFEMNPLEIRKELQERFDNGERFIGSENCVGFDPIKGICPGHEKSE